MSNGSGRRRLPSSRDSPPPKPPKNARAEAAPAGLPNAHSMPVRSRRPLDFDELIPDRPPPAAPTAQPSRRSPLEGHRRRDAPGDHRRSAGDTEDIERAMFEEQLKRRPAKPPRRRGKFYITRLVYIRLQEARTTENVLHNGNV